ncbi:MAG: hypothetical protein ACLT98_12955 [Eggerthellaceae bacterium]
MLVAGVAFAATWQKKSLQLNVSSAFRVLFPFVITSFVLLTFLGEGFSILFAGTMYAFYSCGITLMMAQCAQASRDRGINPVFMYGFFGGIVYMLHDAGYIMGLFAGNLTMFGLQPLTSIALFSVYLHARMLRGSGQFRQALSPNRARAGGSSSFPPQPRRQRKRPSASVKPKDSANLPWSTAYRNSASS